MRLFCPLFAFFVILFQVYVATASDIVVGKTTTKSLKVEDELIGCPKSVEAFKKGDYVKAFEWASLHSCPTLKKLSLWKKVLEAPLPKDLKEKDLFLKEGLEFLQENPEFPARAQILKRFESLFHQQTPKCLLKTYLTQTNAPGLEGVYSLASLMSDKKRQAYIRQLFHNVSMTPVQLDKFIKHFGKKLLNEDFQKRFKQRLEKKDLAGAAQVLKIFPGKMPQTLLVQFAFLKDDASALDQFERLPLGDQQDPAVLKAVVMSHLKREDAASVALILDRFGAVVQKNQNLFQPLIIRAARDALITKDYEGANALLALLKNDLSLDYYEAKLLQALVQSFYLNQRKTAQSLLETELRGIGLESLKARYGYWLSRLYEGDLERVQYWLSYAAKFTRSYYGQRACEILGKPLSLTFSQIQKVPENQFSSLENADLFKAARMLERFGEIESVSLMLYRFFYTLSPGQRGVFLAVIEKHFPEYHLELTALAKRPLTARCFYLNFDRFGVGSSHENLKDPLFRAIVRKESNFNPRAISGAGALGLSQLMLATAQKISGNEALTRRELLLDPALNLRIGGLYIETLLNRFEQDPVTALAAYNAGPLPANKWLERYGDPRRGEIDVSLWIEFIPYKETRWYIMSVLENREIYRYLDQQNF